MPCVDVVVETAIEPTFRVRQVAGLFDLPVEPVSRQAFSVELPPWESRRQRSEDRGQKSEDRGQTSEEGGQPAGAGWVIGAIVGPSGSGKSTVARRAYGPEGVMAADALVGGFDWPECKAVVDGFPPEVEGRAITAMLGSVGFSSPPAWLRPYRVLSNGERFRCDLARALLLPRPLVVFDEFTSVVDRQVARFGSAAVARTLRQGRARCAAFVAVTCHYDVLEWLQPDWVLDMATGELSGRWVRPPRPGEDARRPAIRLEIVRAGRGLWRTFGRHHYLSAALSPAARGYAARWEGRPIAYCATMPLYGPRGRRIVHRLVVLPDYQGLGVGVALLNAVAAHEGRTQPVSIVTSHPALIRGLARRAEWRCVRVRRCSRPHSGILRREGRRIGAAGRATASFRWAGVTR